MLALIQRHLYTFSILGAFLVIASCFGAQTASAETQFQFPNVANGSDWNFASKSPDPQLTWLFKNSGTEVANGKTTHILRTRYSGRNKGTRLRIYFTSQPQQVSVTMNVVTCELDAPFDFAGPVRVVLGGREVYRENTFAPKKADHYEKYRVYPSGGGARVNGSEGVVDSSDRFNQSPVCDNYGAYNVPIWVHRENCAPAQQLPGNKCANNGQETYTIDKTGNGNHAIGALNNKLDGKTFTIDFEDGFNQASDEYLTTDEVDTDTEPEMGREPQSGLWYADLDVDLYSNSDTAGPGGTYISPPESVMQRITFNVAGNNVTNVKGNTVIPKMGYRNTDTVESFSRYFGLQGNGGRETDYPGWGQKYAIPFGMACNDRSEYVKGKVIVYDPDVTGYGANYAMVFKRNPSNGNISRLSKDDYQLNGDDTQNVSWDNGKHGENNDIENNRIELTADGSNSVFYVKKMERGYQYMLAIVNPHYAGKLDPSSNVYSLKLPSDSIQGLVNCRYDLDPSITLTPSSFSAYGSTLTVSGSVTNTESSTLAGDHNWRISKAVYSSKPAGLARLDDEDSLLNPCLFIISKSGTGLGCDSGFYTGTYPDDTGTTIDDPVGPYPVGTYVCYMVSVKDPAWNGDENMWRHTQMMCSVAGVNPKIQVWGGDVNARGKIETTVSDITVGQNRRYGSWGEYSVFSSLKNFRMGSGAKLSNEDSDSGQRQWSDLSFANLSEPGVPLYGLFEGDLDPPATSLNGAVTHTGDLEVTSTDDLINKLMPGQSLATLTASGDLRKVFVITGNLKISGNLMYPEMVNAIRSIPNITIIANGGIVVGRNVTRIDTALDTTRLSTCDQVHNLASTNFFLPLTNNDLLKSDMCENRLQFNGPVSADKLFLYRTYDSNSGEAAEIFNLRASNILSSYVGNGPDVPVAVTNSVTELPPRF